MINQNLLLTGDDGYNLTNSLRFRSSASAYLNRTPASAGNRKTWTWSAWVKRSELSSNQSLFAVNATGDYQEFRFTTSNTLQLILDAAANNYAVEVPTVVWRDVSAWYHIVLAVDTTQATSTNRVKIYVNGIQQTVSAVSGFSLPAQNFDTYVNATLPHAIGNFNYLNSLYFNGYMTEINLIDGQALTPSSFGETSTSTGVWQPIKYTGTYGTNGFYLPFTDNSALTTSSNVGLGKDFSGNSNYWTTNNISITAGTTYDSMTDVPTLTSATAANYAVINPLDYNATYLTLSAANLQQTYAGVVAAAASRATMVIPTTGKYYWEVTLTTIGTNNTTIRAGICSPTTAISGNSIDGSATSYLQITSGQKRNNASDSTYGAGFSNGQILQVLYDATAGSIYFGQNNSFANGSGSFNQAFSGATAAFTGLSGEFMPCFITYGGSDIAVNFGQRPFSYTPPTGFVALNTFNLPTPTIGATASSQANKYMNIALYTGTGSSQSITGLGFQPDWTWIKSRSGATDHGLYDAVRGVQKQLESNNTDSETTETTGLTAFGSDGFTVGALAQLNTSSATYVGWNWKANGTGVTNTAGSITSTVSANTTAGFSIVTYTGTGVTATIGHGLGVAPSMVIVKLRSSSGENWNTWHTSLNNTAARILLNTTAAIDTGSPTIWGTGGINPTSTTFQIGTNSGTNGSSSTYVAYCFAPIAGYSAFGSYTGNGSSDGSFIFTGFRPRYVMIKASSTGGAGYDWFIHDTARDTYNACTKDLEANLSLSEDQYGAEQDFLSNGFKLRNTGGGTNQNGVTYIYMAFAEHPFKYSLAR